MNTQVRRFGALSSSEDPNQLAARVKGVILALSGLIIWFFMAAFKISVTPADVTELATAVSEMVAATWVIYGTLKMLLIKYLDKYHAAQV